MKYSDPKGLDSVVVPIAIGTGIGISLCQADPNCRQKMQEIAQQCVDAVGRFKDWMDNLIFNRPKNPPDIGPPNGWVQGPRRGRQYDADGRPAYDIDKPHQGNEEDHVHEWPGGEREEPGRPVSPLPQD